MKTRKVRGRVFNRFFCAVLALTLAAALLPGYTLAAFAESGGGPDVPAGGEMPVLGCGSEDDAIEGGDEDGGIDSSLTAPRNDADEPVVFESGSISAFDAGYGTDGRFPAPIGAIETGSQAIYTRDDLDAVRDTPDGKFHLMQDIDLSGAEWEPIEWFVGIFDGQGHIIQNMTITGAQTDRNNTGLFEFTSDAVVKNVGLDGAVIEISSGEDHFAGGICGFSSGTIDNCFSTGSVSLSSSSSGSTVFAGGICGINNGSVSDCYNEGAIISLSSSSSEAYAGGICGNNFGDATISNCNSAGAVKASSSSSNAWAGGICGANNDGSQISNSYNTAAVEAASSSSFPCAGGICGLNDYSSAIYAGSNTGSITAASLLSSASGASANSGGICGNNYGVVGSSYNTGTVSASASSSLSSALAGGICGYCSGAVSSSYNTGDVSAASPYNCNAGGICGFNDDGGAVGNCFNTGKASASSKSSSNLILAGGICGNNYTGGDISKCYNVGPVSVSAPHPQSGGICGNSIGTVGNCYARNLYGSKWGAQLTPAQMKVPSNYKGFDFSAVWDISPSLNNGYPYLRDTMVVDWVYVGNGEPVVTGPDSMSLEEGYAATSTAEFTITGSGTVNVTQNTNHGGKIVWNNGAKKLDIGEGLKPGEYPVVLTAKNGITPNAVFTFTLTVEAVYPRIAGPAGMTLGLEYAAASSAGFTVTGKEPVTVSQDETYGGKITWSDTEKRLDVAAGLSPGGYPVVLTASNEYPVIAAFTFTLTVKSPDRLFLNKGYAVLEKGGDPLQLSAFYTSDLQAPASVKWKSSDADEEVIIVDTADGLVTAVGEGSAIVTAYNDEYDIAAECRVDVIEGEAGAVVTAVNLLQTTVTSNAISTDYARVPLQLALDQNRPSAAALSLGALPENPVRALDAGGSGNSIKSVTLLSDTKGYFTTRVADDRYVELIPTEALIKATKVNTLKTKLSVELNGPGEPFTTKQLTIKITRAKPKLKAAAVKFNSFFPDNGIPLTITANTGVVSGISLVEQKNTDYGKVVFDKLNNTLRLKDEKAKPKKLVFSVTVNGFADGYKEYPVTVKPTVKSSKPSVKLSMGSVVMSKSAALRVTGAGAPAITGLTVNNPDYSVTKPDGSGEFVLTYTAGAAVTAKANLKFYVAFEGTDQTLPLSFTVNKPPASGAVNTTLSKKTILLNKAMLGVPGDTAALNVTTSPWDAPVPSVTGDAASLFNIDYATKAFSFSLNGDVPPGSYKLKIGGAELAVKVVGAAPVIGLKAKGSFNVVNPAGTVTLTPAFTNYNYGGAGVTVHDSDGTAAPPESAFFKVISVSQSGVVVLGLMPGVTYTPGQKKSVVLKYSDARGDYYTKAISITPKQAKPKLSQSVKQINLQKNDVYSEGRVDIFVKSPAAARIDRVEIKGAAHSSLYQIRTAQNGSYAIGFKDHMIGAKVGKGAKVKLDVYFAGSDKPVSIPVKIAVG